MIGALYTGITGMDAAGTAMEVIANNVANVNTAAFKSGTTSFASIYSDSVSMGSQSGNEKGRGVQVVALGSAWEQGNLESTQSPTDLAIQGDGFFRVVEDGISQYYTRAGQFSYDVDSRLTDPDGRVVQGYVCDPLTGLPNTAAVVDIDIDDSTHTNINFGADGLITGENLATGLMENLFQVSLFDFANIDGLRKVTGNLYQEAVDSGPPLYANGQVSGSNGVGEIMRNNLEMSNVDLAREFVDLIVTQKAFQANSRVISTTSEMLTEVLNIMR